ncbi:hypothetical protein RCH20_002554 [Psychrobacter sp. PL15]|nr:hypothetical protein [Psychrobacter sp. PL15]
MELESYQTKTHNYKNRNKAHKTHANVLDHKFMQSEPNQV